ncbi:MAG: hypothetical protein IJF49_09035 [Clostridia bacterium]|nr:hypothetical protein [Clostridia bacterium]
MRKFGVFLLVLAFLFTACSPVETDGEEQSTSADTTIAAEPIHITEIIIEESSASLGGDSEKILRYPVVVGEGTDALNENLKRHAEQMYTIHATSVHTLLAEGETFVYAVTSVETKRFDDTLLSFLCRAEYTSPTDGMPKQFVYTCNINPTTAEIYSSDVLITDWTALAQLLRAGKGEMVWGSEELLTQITWDELLMQIKPEYGIYPAVCFNDGGVVIGFDVLTLLGGTAGFCISYADAADCLAVSAPQN